MRIIIEVKAGQGRDPTPSDMDRNINALNKAINREPLSPADIGLLMDTRSILQGIREKLTCKI